MRGKASCAVNFMQADRITPACAGKRKPPPGTGKGGRDHPRLCGEKKGGIRKKYISIGSPPPVRGKADIIEQAIAAGGITPACAGKSLRFLPFPGVIEDHPRLCGEKRYVNTLSKHFQGSPPPVRGKVREINKRVTIPGDHPRLCGEKYLAICLILFHPGSPPPVRGKGYTMTQDKINVRITPACAGKSPHHPRLPRES